MLKVTENICDAMGKYNVRSKLPFRYKRGGKYTVSMKQRPSKGATSRNVGPFQH